MKALKIAAVSLIIALSLIFSLGTKAQTPSYPWTFGLGWHWTDFQAVEFTLSEQITDANWIGEPWPTKFSVSRYIWPSLNVGASFGFHTFERDSLMISKLEYIPLTDKFLWNGDISIQYSLANGYLINEYSWFTPYIFGDIGVTQINKEIYFQTGYGVGLEAWFIDNLGVNFEASYDYLPDYHDYFHFSLGLKARFGKVKDSDNDGIPDKKDFCPMIPGVHEFEGCPDNDADGVVDSLDRCPNEKGLIEFQGCRDSDRDGIPDIDDECPDEKGPAELQGCPDTDGDGVLDKDDDCPQLQGPASSNGCPDTDGDGVTDNNDDCPDDPGIVALNGCPDGDGDGVADKDDKCPDQVGAINNYGCPFIDEAMVAQIQEDLQFNAQSIQFTTGSYIIKTSSYPSLNRIFKTMVEYPATKFKIEGYTDNVGSTTLNQDLSENRADAVKQYFIDSGIDPERLSAKGFGEQNPVATNTTPQGRAKNRRVEIHLWQGGIDLDDSNEISYNPDQVGKFTVQIGAGKDMNPYFMKYPGVKRCKGNDGLTRYIVGVYNSRAEAEKVKKEISNKGYKDAWVAVIDGNRISCY